MERGYSDFLNWAITGELEKFYGDQRWAGWRSEVPRLRADQAYAFCPCS